jgi:hypothetical protein
VSKNISWDRHNRDRKKKFVPQPLVQIRRSRAAERATDRDEDMGRLQDVRDSRGHPVSLPKLRFLGDQP